MQYLMSRFGGHAMIIGQGKASVDQLPEDQSLDNMLDNYAKEIIPNHFYISSYDALPKWMGKIQNLTGTKAVKLGSVTHRFNELFLQYDSCVTTDIYITNHQWNNVFALIIKTHKGMLNELLGDYNEQYDYVLQVFIRSKIDGYDQSLSKNPAYVEKMLLILFYKMGLIYEGDIIDFRPSKTHLGKKIAKEFTDTIAEKLIGIETDADLRAILLEYESKNNVITQ
ncbi:MAG: hypothetical protein FGM16_04000 [Flavobacterium sp.]|nr:hypothetical protein [Flavobacterium sp.]